MFYKMASESLKVVVEFQKRTLAVSVREKEEILLRSYF